MKQYRIKNIFKGSETTVKHGTMDAAISTKMRNLAHKFAIKDGWNEKLCEIVDTTKVDQDGKYKTAYRIELK